MLSTGISYRRKVSGTVLADIDTMANKIEEWRERCERGFCAAEKASGRWALSALGLTARCGSGCAVVVTCGGRGAMVGETVESYRYQLSGYPQSWRDSPQSHCAS